MTIQFDEVSVLSKANVFFDGKCVSHTVISSDGQRKTLGIIFPSSLEFNTKVAELMQITAGECRVKIADATETMTYRAGEEFSVPAQTRFTIEASEIVEYICHFGE